MIIEKECSNCKRNLPEEFFRKQADTKDGLQYECKDCTNQRAKERYEAKQDEILAKNTNWQCHNKDKHAAASKKHYDSPTGRIARGLNKRLDHLVGKNRESFLHLIGLTPSVLLVHLNGSLPEDFKLEDYGTKWVVSFVCPVAPSDLDTQEGQRLAFNWKNLKVKVKQNKKTIDLETLGVT